MKISPQKGTMKRTQEAWDYLATLPRPKLDKDSYAGLVVRVLTDGPQGYGVIMDRVDLLRRTTIRYARRRIRYKIKEYPQWVKNLESIIRDYHGYLKGVPLPSHLNREFYTEDYLEKEVVRLNTKIIDLELKVEHAELQDGYPDEKLTFPLDEGNCMEPNFSLMIARMDAAGQIKRLSRGTYSL